MRAAHWSRRRLGLQILFDFSDITEALRFAAEHGFGALELNLGNIAFGQQLRRKPERRRIAAVASDLGVKLAFHGLDGPSFYIASRRVLRAGVAEHERTMDYAAEVGALNVVMHLGFDLRFGMGKTGRYSHEVFPGYFEEAISFGLSELKRHAAGRCRLCVENVGGFRYGPAQKVLPGLLGGNLGLCYDVGHVNILAPDMREAEMEFFERFKRFVHHAHIHDNHGKRDEHRAVGEGKIDFLPFFRFLVGTDALVVFETRPKEAALKSLRYYGRHIEPMLKTEKEPQRHREHRG